MNKYVKINRNSLGQFLRRISRYFLYVPKGCKPYVNNNK